MRVELREGLEIVDEGAFYGCTSLESITIPSTVKVIGKEAFVRCTRLMQVELREGLESISNGAFYECTSLERISIPSTVHYIEKDVFGNCSALEAVEFCEEIEEFVSAMALRPWWNNGTSKLALWTGSFLARCNIPCRVAMLNKVWKANIHAMLQRIPSLTSYNEDEEFFIVNAPDDPYFDSIQSQLDKYEYVQDVAQYFAPILELALWKLKITERSNDNLIDYNGKLMCRIDSLSMVSIIIPNVLSFLVVEY